MGVVVATGVAWAEPPAEVGTATVRVYADDDHLTVVSPAAHAQLASTWLAVDLDVAIDAVSAASVDVITAASPTAVVERRVEAGVGVTVLAAPTAAVRLGTLVSHEHDYDAVRVGASVVTDWAQRNTTVELRGWLGRDHATDVSDPRFVGDRRSAGLVAVVTQLLDRRTIADLTVDGSWADGWHGSPYRRIVIADPAMPVVTRWREVTPARRLALAAALRLRRAIGDDWFATATGRGYLDDWQVHSATVAVDLRRRLGAATLVGVGVRGYAQDAAGFWVRRQPDATTPPDLRTADRTLGPMVTAQLDLVGERGLGPSGRRVTVAVGGLGLWFLDHVAQTRRLAVTATVSFAAPL